MKRRVLLMTVLVILLLAVGAGSAAALAGPNFNLVNNSARGGGAGGGALYSQDYILVVGFGGLTGTALNSSSFQLCSGFVCDANAPVWHTYLPKVER